MIASAVNQFVYLRFGHYFCTSSSFLLNTVFTLTLKPDFGKRTGWLCEHKDFKIYFITYLKTMSSKDRTAVATKSLFE